MVCAVLAKSIVLCSGPRSFRLQNRRAHCKSNTRIKASRRCWCVTMYLAYHASSGVRRDWLPSNLEVSHRVCITTKHSRNRVKFRCEVAFRSDRLSSTLQPRHPAMARSMDRAIRNARYGWRGTTPLYHIAETIARYKHVGNSASADST